MPFSEHSCCICSKSFSNASNLKRHARIHSSQGWQRCDTCGYTTERVDSMKRHLITYHTPGTCEAVPFKKPRVQDHGGAPQQSAASATNLRCGMPQHASMTKPMTSEVVQAIVTEDKPAVEPDSSHIITIEDILEMNSKWIHDFAYVNDRYQDRYNFQVRNPTPEKLEQLVKRIFLRQKYAFKLNVSFGYVLYDNVTEKHEFYYASTNNRMLDKPLTISCAKDVARFVDALSREDILEFCKAQRKNSRFVVERITNALFYVNKIKDFYIGCPNVVLPDYLLRKPALMTLVSDNHHGPYTDNFCLFRCIAFHQNGGRRLQQANDMAQAYCRANQVDVHSFKGVALGAIPNVEDFFRVNIVVYSLEQEQDGEETKEVAKKVQESRRIYDTTVNVNLYGNHFSYIKDLLQFASRWQCKKCDKLFRRRNQMVEHERRCQARTTFEYAQGGYGLSKTIFEQIREAGCKVDVELDYYIYRIAFDFEAMTKIVQVHDENAKLKYTRRHIPASVSVCSNVPGYEQPRCLLSAGDADELVGAMYSYMVEISGKSFELLRERYADVIAWLQEKVEQTQELRDQLSEGVGNRKELEDQIYRQQVFGSLLTELETWLRRIPVLGFNSGKYDVNLIRQHLFPYMLKNDVEVDHIIKKGNDYLSITTDDLLFLDVKNFIAPATSYAQWLKANEVEMEKSFWPYEWFQNLEQLEQTTSLVPRRHFFSKLKQETISVEDYRHLQEVWKKEKFRNMKDLLVYYNNRDTLPFIQAAQKMHDLWRALGIDAFKESCISVPGLALRLMMKRMQKHTILPLLKEPEIFDLVKSNIVGGLAVVMHRYHKAGETRLPNGKLVDRIYSLDCNSLYLWALGEELGTGLYAVWTPHSDQGVDSMKWERGMDRCKLMKWHDVKRTNEEVLFHREQSYRNMKSQLEWVEYTAYSRGIEIEHKFNGREKVIHVSKDEHYPVDGYHPASNTVFQFHGCLWHGHGCHLDTEPSRRLERSERTRRVDQQIKDLGYNLCIIRECEWIEQKKRNPEISQFAEENFNLPVKTNHLTAGEIIKLIESGGICGMVLCDIEVPAHNQHLLEHFAEFPPIYKNTEVSINQIGEHMKEYAEKNGLLRKPRRHLINSYWAREILLTTPLLQWYLKNGLVITKIYKVIEMKGKRCFEQLRQEIADKRRKGDLDPKFMPEGQTWKLVGNSCYGKTVTDKLRHKETKLALDAAMPKLINNKRFCAMEEVGDEAYEVSLDKRKINQDLPIHVGFFVYCGSKLRMLQFIYDFLKKFLREGSFQMICSDTDSIMAAFEDRDIDKLVKLELVKEYQEAKKLFLVTDDYSQRQPGPFKVECEASGAVALCAKTYYTWDDEKDTVKLSTKGLSKINKFTRDHFLDVLKTQKPGTGVNHGLRMKGQDMMQYEQSRAGLSYLYFKREVLADQISTRPLDC